MIFSTFHPKDFFLFTVKMRMILLFLHKNNSALDLLNSERPYEKLTFSFRDSLENNFEFWIIFLSNLLWNFSKILIQAVGYCFFTLFRFSFGLHSLLTLKGPKRDFIQMKESQHLNTFSSKSGRLTCAFNQM